MLKHVLLVIAFSLITGCVSGPSKPEYKPAEVVDRQKGYKDTPEWADPANPMFEEGSDVVFISSTRMSGNFRPEACLKAADLDARSGMLRHVRDNITSSGQLNEMSASDDPAYESLVAFLSNGTINGAKVAARYWEKIEESDESGERVLRVRCAVKVAVKKTELARQLREATRGPGGNPKIREKLIEGQQNFLDSISKQESVAH